MWCIEPYGVMGYGQGKNNIPCEKIYPDGATKEMVAWKLPFKTKERPHGLKYRLFYGAADGACLIRYDNEKGKGDHKHIGGREKPYQFKDFETLAHDFQRDIEKIRGGSHDRK